MGAFGWARWAGIHTRMNILVVKFSGPVGSCHGRVKTDRKWERKVQVFGMSGLRN